MASGMAPDRWHKIEALFEGALALDLAQRAAFLDQNCGGDLTLRNEVESLLSHGENAGGFLRVPAAPQALEVGRRVSRYEIQGKLGEGGMGAVYRAWDSQLRRPVALKVLPPEYAADPERRERLLREARAASALSHPNIVGIHEVGTDSGIDFIAMEFVEGTTLQEAIPAKGLPLAKVRDYAVQIAGGLAKAHAAGVVHRDLKPGNIMLTSDAHVKLLDFGLARRVQLDREHETTLTAEGGILGTPAYMSPEQAEGKPLDARSDIFSFGAVLYEMVTGRRPFTGDTQLSLLTRIVNEDPTPPGELVVSIPPDLEKIILRCLRKDPARRYQTVADLKVALEDVALESGAGKPRTPPPPATASRRRWPWATGAVALVALAILAWYRWEERPATPFQHIQITRLTDTGKATAAAISPDGKYVVHVVTDDGKSSLWMLHAATGSNVQILPQTQEGFYTLRFSRDGNTLYYALYAGEAQPVMYTIPVLGGNARALASYQGLTLGAISPDEKRFVLARNVDSDRGLFLKNLDGSGERKLAGRKAPDSFAWPAWSPDGMTIAYGVMTQAGPSTALAAIPVDGGPERRISARIGFNLGALGWMPDGRGLIAVANLQFPSLQLWYVAYPGGQTRSITNDLNSYSGVSLTGDGSALVTVHNEAISHLWVISPRDPGSARVISTGRLDGLNFVAFAGNGNLYFEAPDSSGTTQVWRTAPDGTGRRQITEGESLSGQPAPCGDDRHLLFTSYRAGMPHIFVSDPDGGNVRQLTGGEAQGLPSCSPDGAWLTYVSRDSKSMGVWRMPIDGGSPARVWDPLSYSEISPDGKSILVTGAGGKATILPAGGGPPIKSLEGVPRLSYSGAVRWSAEGTALLYVKTVGGVSNVWQRPIHGGEAKQLTAFTSQRITAFAVSRDGRQLALARGTTSSDVVLIKDLK